MHAFGSFSSHLCVNSDISATFWTEKANNHMNRPAPVRAVAPPSCSFSPRRRERPPLFLFSSRVALRVLRLPFTARACARVPLHFSLPPIAGTAEIHPRSPPPPGAWSACSQKEPYRPADGQESISGEVQKHFTLFVVFVESRNFKANILSSRDLQSAF